VSLQRTERTVAEVEREPVGAALEGCLHQVTAGR
jgi:hypothetical protein